MGRLTLRDFQKEDVAFMRHHNYRVLVANGQGTGKTIECLACISIDRKKLCPAVIVCPASVLWNWHSEARKWCKWARIHVVKGLEEPFPQKRAHIYIVSWSLVSERLGELLKTKPKLLIADEVQYAKNSDAIRSKAISMLSSNCEHLLMLSGTPLVNTRADLDTIHSYFGTEKPPMIRRLLNDVAPDVPPKERMVLPVFMRPRHVKKYTKAFNEFDTWLREELEKRMSKGEAEDVARRALRAEALIKIGYLRRIVGEAKTYSAVDWISRAVRVGEPVVLFCEHSQVIRRIKKMLKRLGIQQVTVDGSTPKKKRQEYVERFQKGHVPVFIGSRACITGITLTRARHLCFVERFWTSADEEQAEDRIRRISQRYPTKIWFLHVEKTVDDRIAQIVDRKRLMVSKAIGSEDIDQLEEDAVLEFLSKWNDQVEAPTYNGNAMLGLTGSLPALPKPKDVQSVEFYGKRWNEPAVKAWCRMNKYRCTRVKKISKGWMVISRQASNFEPTSIKSVSVSKQIKVFHGIKLDKGKIAKQRRHARKVASNKVLKRTRKI